MQKSAPKIILNTEERQLVSLLKGCADWLDGNPALWRDTSTSSADPHTHTVELRLAGGWVRDKLLGEGASDLDVATGPRPLTGKRFVELLHEHCKATGQTEGIGKYGVIAANPEQSKHLETAVTKLFSYSVDFVQFRGNEVYSEDSRIPQATFGTPTQDAFRRDLTINSLFYNVRTEEVEDLTGRGVADLLRDKVIRTPLAPLETFRDDPLRVLRAIRFAGRFPSFSVSEELCAAAAAADVRLAFSDAARKVSRERVGKELEKMMQCESPARCISLIVDWGLYTNMFVPAEAAAYSLEARAAVFAARLVDDILARRDPQALLSIVDLPVDRARHMTAAALVPFFGQHVSLGRKEAWAGALSLRELLKFSNTDSAWVESVHAGAGVIASVVGDSDTCTCTSRGALGLVLRQISSARTPAAPVTWFDAVVYAYVHDVAQGGSGEAYASLLRTIAAYGLRHDVLSPPLLTGHEVLGVLRDEDMLPPKHKMRVFSSVLDELLKVQLESSGTTRDALVSWLRANKARVADIFDSA